MVDTSLMFRAEILVGDTDLEVISIEMAFKAMGQVEISRRVSVNEEEL